MIILISSILLFIIFLTPILYNLRHDLKHGDLFRPSRIVSFIHLVSIVPYLLFLGREKGIMSPLVLNHRTMDNLDYTVFLFVVIQICGFLMLLLGLKSSTSAKMAELSPSVGFKISRKRMVNGFIIALTIGILGYSLFMYKIGGLSTLLYNLESRSFLIAGNGYITSIIFFIQVALMILIFSFKNKNSKTKLLIWIALSIICMLILSSLGGRKSTIELVFISLLVWHYGVKRIRRIPFLKSMAIIVLLCLYFIAIPLIRAPGGFEYYTNNMDQLWEDIYSNSETLIKQTSYVDHYLLVINYFDSETYWWGKSFIDLLTAPIPSSIYPNKPPVDEGVYLRTIAEGFNPVPPTPYSDLYKSSWPPETFGVMYMNFGFLGVILGMYILGAIYRFTYEYMKRSSFSLYSIIIYGVVLFSFHLSNLRIVQFGIEFLWLTIFFMIVFGLKIKRIKSI